MNANHLTENRIIELLKKNSSQSFEDVSNGSYRRAAVLVPLLLIENEWHLLFTRRTEEVQYHKGQVSFPGGAAEPGDRSIEWTALREACEEIGVRPRYVRVLGRLEPVTTISQYLVTPVVGRVKWPLATNPAPNEVSRIFTIPLTWLAESSNWEERPYELPDGNVHRVIFFREYDGELLWGISAKITLMLLRSLGLLSKKLNSGLLAAV
jgi:8-oxo-dGTP pyrophosphatase MutT (NUDIX family)